MPTPKFPPTSGLVTTEKQTQVKINKQMAVPKGYKKSSCFGPLTFLSYGGSPPDVKHPGVLEVLMKDLSHSTAHPLPPLLPT